MNLMTGFKGYLLGVVACSVAVTTWGAPPNMKMTTDIPASITVPASVETSTGTLEYFDGVPTPATVDSVFDYVDRARAVGVFINMMPAVSMYQLRQGRGRPGSGSDQGETEGLPAGEKGQAVGHGIYQHERPCRYDTVPPTDYGFYEQLNSLVQEEPIEWLDPELRG